MQALASNMMYMILYGYIGKEVSCLAFEDGEYVEYRGTLNEVLPFNSVRIDDDVIPFITGETGFIKEIVSLDTNKSLYMNLDKLIDPQDMEYSGPKA